MPDHGYAAKPCVFESHSGWPTDDKLEAERNSRTEIKTLLERLDKEGCLSSNFSRFSLSRIDLLIRQACDELASIENGVVILSEG